MLANSRLSGLATCIRLACMRTHATISGSELLLSVIAIRLAMLVLVGWGLTLLPRQARRIEPTCASSSTASDDAQAPVKMASDPAFDDMRRHD